MFSQSLYCQSTNESPDKAPEYAPLPDAYRSLALGMDIQMVQERLLTEARFDFRGEPDVSMRKNGSQSLISVKGRSFIDRGSFQFRNRKLFLIILEINPEKMDFFTLQQNLWQKYGPPDEISPQGMHWENEKLRLALEYPLTVKYLDIDSFNSLLTEELQLKSFQEISREDFLEDF